MTLGQVTLGQVIKKRFQQLLELEWIWLILSSFGLKVLSQMT